MPEDLQCSWTRILTQWIWLGGFDVVLFACSCDNDVQEQPNDGLF